MGFLKIDGMTSSATAENNCQKDIIKDVIGEVSIYYSDEPDEVHFGPGLKIYKNECEYEVRINNSIERSVYYYDERDSIEISPDEIEISPDEEVRVYTKKYLCSLTKTVFEKSHICRVSRHMAISEYNIESRPSSWRRDSLTNIPIIYTPSFRGSYGSYFVFNYVDTCKQKILALLMMLNRLRSLNQSTVQAEVIETHLLPLLGYVDGKKTQQISSLSLEKEYTCEYKGKIPEYVSMAQLKKLYELGMVKMMILSSSSVTENLYILSDDAFDNDPDGFLQKKFETKFNMHGYIKRELNRLFL